MILRNKHVFITGAAHGLGRCLAQEFAEAGSVLALADIDVAELECAAATLRETASEVHTFGLDVGSPDRVRATARDVLARLGHLDILINNAGIAHTGEFVETPMRTWKRLMDVDFWGPMNLIHAFLPSMVDRGSGHIVNVASGQAFFRLPIFGPYTTVKIAFGAYSEMLQLEIKKLGVNVTTVYPFVINSPNWFAKLNGRTAATRLSLKLAPLVAQRPEKVARTVRRAVVANKRVELVTPLNWIGFHSQIVPSLMNLANRMVLRLLGKPRDELVQTILANTTTSDGGSASA